MENMANNSQNGINNNNQNGNDNNSQRGNNNNRFQSRRTISAVLWKMPWN